MARRLSRREKRAYRQGGFRLEGRTLSAADVTRQRLQAAARILRLWGAGPRAARATLALTTSKALARWRRGKTAIPSRTSDRIAVILALYRHLVAGFDFPAVQPLPDLKRPGRAPLAGKALLERGRLSDLLALLRQLVLEEEAVERRERRRQAGPRARRTPRPR